MSKQVGYTRGEAESLLLLSDLQNRFDHAAAILMSKSSLALWKSLGDKEGTARAHIRIGTFYLAQSLVEDATQNFLQALDVWRSLDNVPQQAEALIMLGFIEYRKGDWQASIDYYTQAYSMFDEGAEAQKMGQLSSGLGAAFNESGLPETAVVQYERALKHYEKLQNPIAVSYALYRLDVRIFWPAISLRPTVSCNNPSNVHQTRCPQHSRFNIREESTSSVANTARHWRNWKPC